MGEDDDHIPTDAEAAATQASINDMYKPHVPTFNAPAPAKGESLEDQAGDQAGAELKAEGPTLSAASLKTDHPYGDGKHGETGADTMRRLGAGIPYGGQ
jgi:hypothetical protein